MAVNGWPVCLQKQSRIDELEEEVKKLRAKLRYQERRDKEGLFESSPPSSKLPVKPTSQRKNGSPEERVWVTKVRVG